MLMEGAAPSDLQLQEHVSLTFISVVAIPLQCITRLWYVYCISNSQTWPRSSVEDANLNQPHEKHIEQFLLK